MNSFMEWKTFDFSGQAVDLLDLFKDEPFVFLLESSLKDSMKGRYSFIGFDPFMTFQNSEGEALEDLRKQFLRYAATGTEKDRSPSPFPAGIMGYLGYDLGLSWEGIPRRHEAATTIPPCSFGFYDCIVTVDHFARKLYLSSSGLPEKGTPLRQTRARERLKGMTQKLAGFFPKKGQGETQRTRSHKMEYASSALRSNFTKGAYLKAVQKALEYIRQGDIYQVNLAQQFCFDAAYHGRDINPVSLYQQLRKLSPSCFGGYWDGGDFQIISSSPERFLRLKDNLVSTRPMKGTRPRGRNDSEDAWRKKELLQSQKDKAELLMITDLARNDLGRVCDYGSVQVKEMRTLESYRTVFQATSTIEGLLREDKDCFDLLRACFPGGSITGCPKIRAMQIIEEIEPDPRSIYTGSLGYISFSGNMDFNILIRTLLAERTQVRFHVGGGIVADSSPEGEYNETLVKAMAMQACLRGGQCLEESFF